MCWAMVTSASAAELCREPSADSGNILDEQIGALWNDTFTRPAAV
jgi:hypothetical protein